MNRCIYCYKRLGTADLNNVCSECANERKGTYATTQPIILSRVDFSEKTPTAEEVCKAYCDYFHCPLTYNKITKQFVEIKGGRARGRIIARLFIDEIDIPHKLPPHLITLIGRFYEGLK